MDKGGGGKTLIHKMWIKRRFFVFVEPLPYLSSKACYCSSPSAWQSAFNRVVDIILLCKTAFPQTQVFESLFIGIRRRSKIRASQGCTVLDSTVPYCTALQCTELHCTSLHYSALYCTAMASTAVYCSALHFSALHCTALNWTELNCTVVYCIALHCTALHLTALH